MSLDLPWSMIDPLPTILWHVLPISRSTQTPHPAQGASRCGDWGSSTFSFGKCCSFKFPSQVDKTSESKECPNIFCFSDFCFPNTFFPNKTSQRITPKIRRLHHEPTCWVKTAGFLLPKVCHGLRRRVFFQHFPNRRQCETDSGRCMADIFTSPQNTVDPCVTSIDGMKEVDAIDHEDDDLKWAPDLFFAWKSWKGISRCLSLVMSPLQSNSHSFSKLKHFNPKSSEASFPNILVPSLFSKLHVLHRKGPTLSTSTRAPVFHGKNRGNRRRHRWSFWNSTPPRPSPQTKCRKWRPTTSPGRSTPLPNEGRPSWVGSFSHAFWKRSSDEWKWRI